MSICNSERFLKYQLKHNIQKNRRKRYKSLFFFAITGASYFVKFKLCIGLLEELQNFFGEGVWSTLLGKFSQRSYKGIWRDKAHIQEVFITIFAGCLPCLCCTDELKILMPGLLGLFRHHPYWKWRRSDNYWTMDQKLVNCRRRGVPSVQQFDALDKYCQLLSWFRAGTLRVIY